MLQPVHSTLVPHAVTFMPLTGAYFYLEALDYQHLEMLLNLAKDSRIWEFFPLNGTDDEHHLRVLTQAIQQRETGEHYPFVIRHRQSGALAGYTRLYGLDFEHRKLETGTWIHPHYWGTGANIESKVILLRFCFEILGMRRVQFKTAPDNVRSRKALEKLGATFEGILRNDRMLHTGNSRHTAVYSIILEEWPSIETRLNARILQPLPPSLTSDPAFQCPINPFLPLESGSLLGSAPAEMPVSPDLRH